MEKYCCALTRFQPSVEIKPGFALILQNMFLVLTGCLQGSWKHKACWLHSDKCCNRQCLSSSPEPPLLLDSAVLNAGLAFRHAVLEISLNWLRQILKITVAESNLMFTGVICSDNAQLEHFMSQASCHNSVSNLILLSQCTTDLLSK